MFPISLVLLFEQLLLLALGLEQLVQFLLLRTDSLLAALLNELALFAYAFYEGGVLFGAYGFGGRWLGGFAGFWQEVDWVLADLQRTLLYQFGDSVYGKGSMLSNLFGCLDF